jgi:ABC-type sugar transport system permease subunit
MRVMGYVRNERKLPIGNRLRTRILPYLLLLPPLLVSGIFLIYPLCNNIYLSFFSFGLINPVYKFVGLTTYSKLLSTPSFGRTIVRTFVFTGSVVAAQSFAGMGIALLLSKEIKGQRLFRFLILLPYVTTRTVVALMWRILFDPDFSPINTFLRWVHFSPPAWIADPSIAPWAMVVTKAWNGMPFVTLVFLAGLQSLPQEPYDAARVDGASTWQIFTLITLPLMRPIIIVILTFQTIFTFRAFDIIWVLTAGGPGDATTILGVLIYQTLFWFWKGGTGAAISVIMLIFTLLTCILFFRFLSKEVEV